MTRELVYYNLFMSQGVTAEFFINDLPLFESLVRGQVTGNGPINELLAPGDNELSIRLLRETKLLHEEHYLRFYLFKILGGVDGALDIEILHDVRFPQRFEEVAEPRRSAPFHHRAVFDPAIEAHAPPHFAAEVEAVPDDGTPALRDAVRALHEALSAADGARYVDLSLTSMQLRQDAYAGHPEHSVAFQRRVYADFFAAELEVAPLDLGDLHFESRAGGRVVYVRRIDGRPVLWARQKHDPTEILEARLTFIKQRGSWQRYC